MNECKHSPSEWESALRRVQREGFLDVVREVGPDAFVAAPGRWGWGAAARELCLHLPGQMLPGKSHGIGWKCGSGPMRGTDLDGDAWARVQEAREAVRAVVPVQERGPLPFSVGACARVLLTWAVDAQEPERAAEGLLWGAQGEAEDRRIQYHDCQPGRYPSAVMYDCSAYYYRLLQRLPSVRCSVLPKSMGNGSDGVLWHKMRAGERARWRDVLDAAAGAKVLRNALWGCMLGSYERRTAYTRDRRTGRPRIIRPCFGPGPNRPAAVVLARSAWEMCRRASEETCSVYSTVDSVTAINGARPKVWDSVGLPWGPKHEGAADVVMLGCWRIGPHPTVPYRQHSQGLLPAEPERVPLATAPAVEFYRQWL